MLNLDLEYLNQKYKRCYNGKNFYTFESVNKNILRIKQDKNLYNNKIQLINKRKYHK